MTCITLSPSHALRIVNSLATTLDSILHKQSDSLCTYKTMPLQGSFVSVGLVMPTCISISWYSHGPSGGFEGWHFVLEHSAFGLTYVLDVQVSHHAHLDEAQYHKSGARSKHPYLGVAVSFHNGPVLGYQLGN